MAISADRGTLNLKVFRIGFGLMMLAAVVRFWAKGWIEKLYLEPSFHFSYRYFEWVEPLGEWTYVLFAVVGLAALCIALGYRYRLAVGVFFLGFTYVELMDKTTYLNHYYFISLLSLLLLFLPMPRRGANGGNYRFSLIVLRIFVGLVYFHAGLAKLNSDWLLHAQPLATWLPARYDLPVIGSWLQERWVHYLFAWGGAAFDLSIPFLLAWRKTVWWAYGAVVIFHAMTAWLFPIGMFPWVMVVAATVFLPLGRDLSRQTSQSQTGTRLTTASALASVLASTLLLFHALFPLRAYFRPGSEELFWTEDGFRFSWRVMLMEKAGYASFRVVGADGQRAVVDNREFLTVFQEKQLATQPDFIVEYAHFLADIYAARGFRHPAVYVESYVALNGRGSQPYVDPTVDLTTLTQDTPRESYLLPFNDLIYGL